MYHTSVIARAGDHVLGDSGKTLHHQIPLKYVTDQSIGRSKRKVSYGYVCFRINLPDQKKKKIDLNFFFFSPKVDATIQIHITHTTMQHIQLYKSLFYSPTVNMETLVEEQKNTLKLIEKQKTGLGILNRKKKCLQSIKQQDLYK